METFLVSIIALSLLLLYLTFTFTRERSNKYNYLKRVIKIMLISLLCSMIALPIYGPIFGFASLLLNSVVLGTLIKFK